LKHMSKRGAKEETKEVACDLKEFKFMKEQIAKLEEQIKSK